MISTFRRYYLDRFLAEHTRIMKGKVFDLGGKRVNKRGDFRPPQECAGQWYYLNIDRATQPDCLGCAESLPVRDACFDTVIACELLEHLVHPEETIREAYRILKPGGVLIASCPFLFPYHPDPRDLQRWTPEKWKSELSRNGFTTLSIRPMGGVFATIHDLLYVFINRYPFPALFKRLLSLGLGLSARPFLFLDRLYQTSSVYSTTGYFVVARREMER